MALVLDASVILAWSIPDEASWYADAVQDALASGQTAIAPCHWPVEIANGLLTAERRGRIDMAGIDAFLEDLEFTPIQTEEASLRAARTSIMELPRRHGLTPYDAAYLELAHRRAEPLATLDNRLVSAARASNVPLWRPPRSSA